MKPPLSRFLPDSDISRINRGSGSPVPVAPLTIAAVEAALTAAEETGGLFDPTVHAALLAAGYDRTLAAVQSGEAEDSRRHTAQSEGWRPRRYAEVRIDHGALTVQLPAGVGLDLGGIAKGWLADTVAGRLREYGAVLIDMGGDIAVRGLPPDSGAWRIAVADPLDHNRILGEIALPSDGGIATSGVTRRRWRAGWTWQHHLIDPRTGLPAITDLLSATVVARNATDAEVAAKAVLLFGDVLGRVALASEPDLAGVVVRRDGTAAAVGNLAWQPAPSRLTPPWSDAS